MRAFRRASASCIALLPLVLLPWEASGQEDGYRRLSGSRVTVHYTGGDSALAAAYLDFLEAQPPLPALPDSLPTGVDAYLVPARAALDSLLGGRVPEWSAGVAVPSRSLLAIPAWQGSLTRPGEASRVLRHEWAHLGLAQYLDPLRIPRWFDEGYAQWASGWTATEAWRLRIALATGGAPALDSLTLAWPRARGDAETAYLLAATVVEYLTRSGGERGLALFLERWRDRESFDEALRATFGVTVGGLEDDWSDWVRSRYGWLFVLSHSTVGWGLLAGVLVILYVIRKRRDRKRMEELREEDPPDRPAWWDPDAEDGPWEEEDLTR